VDGADRVTVQVVAAIRHGQLIDLLVRGVAEAVGGAGDEV
jgi:hypothetical protein